MTAGDVSFTYRVGGPSVLTDDISIYSAIILDTDTNLKKDIKFTRYDTTTFIKSEIYRKDFPYYNTGSQTMNVIGNPLMALGGMETIYYLEQYGVSGWTTDKFLLMKVDFISEQITPVYQYDFTSEGPYQNQLSNFMIVVKDETTQDQYLVWDIVKEVENGGNYSTHSVVETEYDDFNGPIIPPCDHPATLWRNRYDLYQDSHTKGVRGPKVDLFMMKLFADETVTYFNIWENPGNYNGYDDIETIYLTPSPIIYTGKDNVTRLYLVYGMNSDTHPLSLNYDMYSIGGGANSYLICSSVNEHSYCPPPDYVVIDPYCLGGPVLYAHERRAYYEMFQFYGKLFFSICKIDFMNSTSETKHIYNNRSITYRYDTDCAPANYLSCSTDDGDFSEPVGNGPPWDCYQFVHCNPGFYTDTIPHARALTGNGNVLTCPEAWAMRPIPSKVVVDTDAELIYIKVFNPDTTSIYYINETFRNVTSDAFVWEDEIINAQTYGMMALNPDDLNDYKISMFENNKKIFDLLMSKEFAYRVELTDTNEIIIHRISDDRVVANCGIHDYPVKYTDTGGHEVAYEDSFGAFLKLTQQPSTDENMLWKLVPSGAGDEQDTEVILKGYNLEGGVGREVKVVAPFVYNNLLWYNIHQHDGKIILTTADGNLNPPLMGVWMIK